MDYCVGTVSRGCFPSLLILYAQLMETFYSLSAQFMITVHTFFLFFFWVNWVFIRWLSILFWKSWCWSNTGNISVFKIKGNPQQKNNYSETCLNNFCFFSPDLIWKVLVWCLHAEKKWLVVFESLTSSLLLPDREDWPMAVVSNWFNLFSIRRFFLFFFTFVWLRGISLNQILQICRRGERFNQDSLVPFSTRPFLTCIKLSG